MKSFNYFIAGLFFWTFAVMHTTLGFTNHDGSSGALGALNFVLAGACFFKLVGDNSE